MRTFTGFSFRIALSISLFVLVSCATVPLTGRKQLSLVSESEVMGLSLTQYDQFLKSNKVSTNKTETARVRK